LSPHTAVCLNRPTSIRANTDNEVEVAIVGAGVAGIATAYYLCVEYDTRSVLLIDYRQPMSYTSAQSGDNYRNWWPHPTMTAFTDDSIDLMERLARDTNNVFNMSNRGYVLATRRADIDDRVAKVQQNVDADVFSDHNQIRRLFPALSEDIKNVIHIKRGGDISGQQLGTYMLERIRAAGGKRLHGEVVRVTKNSAFSIQVESADETRTIAADVVVNAAGPYAGQVAAMLGDALPVKNVYQQKIAFDDRYAAIPRDMPFSIDLDEKSLGWTAEENALLASDPELAWLTGPLPAGTHCRPDGGAQGTWVKLGWAYNEKKSEPRRDLANETANDPQFMEIVMRGAAALLPSLKRYIETPPARFAHYGGYYTMTKENWPLIGPMGPDGAYVVGALSGFGSMSACAAGKLCAAWVCGDALPDYATDLSLARYEDTALMSKLHGSSDRGLL
jgi:glycine/D-amino acid oxidase-like deaminating enzyme